MTQRFSTLLRGILFITVALPVLAACGTSSTSTPADAFEDRPWRTNPQADMIAMQNLPRPPSPPYAYVALSEAEKTVPALSRTVAIQCNGTSLLALRQAGERNTASAEQVGIWEYEVRRAGANRVNVLSTLREQGNYAVGTELQQDVEACEKTLIEHYEEAGVPLNTLDDHPMARAYDRAAAE